MELKEMFVLPVWTQLTAVKGWATADKGLPKQQQLKPYGATAKLKTTTTFAEFHSFWSTAHDKYNHGSRTLIIITDKKYHASRSQNMYWMIVERPPEHRTTGLWCWKKEPICVGRLSCRDSDHYHDIVVGRVIEYFLMSCFIILAGGLDISPIGRINQQYWNVSIFYFSLDSNPLFLAALATLYFSLVVSGGADSVNNSHVKTMTLITNKKRVANCDFRAVSHACNV